MSDRPTEKAYKSPTVTSGAESPTTARELDFDDDAQETSAPAAAPTSKPTTTSGPILEEAPPPKPPRRRNSTLETLVGVFPNKEREEVEAAFRLFKGDANQASEYLLGIRGPPEDEVPPPQPPRPVSKKTPEQRQLDEDELLARRLHEQFNGPSTRQVNDPRLTQQQQEEREHSFFDDDLPVIQEHLRKVYNETETTVTNTVKGFITNFKNLIDGKDEDEYSNQPGASQQRQNYGPSQSDQLHGIQRNAERSRSGRNRDDFDADPQILDDNFTTLRLQDNDTSQNSRSNRPLANPDLFKPTPAPPQKGPVDEVEALYRQPTPTRQPSPGAGKTKKWQPLTSVAPNPEADDHDPFSLGDSDDEDTKTKDMKADDTERLKRAAADSPVSPIDDKPLEAAERSGSARTRNKEAEELLSKDSKP